MAILITGGAGFVASELAGNLLRAGETVIAIDNLTRGSLLNLAPWQTHPAFLFRKCDLADLAAYRSALAEIAADHLITEVWHLAANSDIQAGVRDPDIDLRDTFLTTFNTLKIMDEFGIKSIYFASSSAIYGDLKNALLTEETGPLFPISNYGAMKLASEAAITAAAERYLDRALIFRFPNVVGVPATHGILFDFMQRLKITSDFLQVLGDGSQQKSYLHVTDLVAAMLLLQSSAMPKVDVFNIGPTDDGVTVRQIAEVVVSLVAPRARLLYQSGAKGWVGDVPKFRYSTAKLQRLGWKPNLDSLGAIERAANEIAKQFFLIG